MTILTRTYPNGHQRLFTVTATVFDSDSAVITTVEDGDVAISLADTPELWAQLLAAQP